MVRYFIVGRVVGRSLILYKISIKTMLYIGCMAERQAAQRHAAKVGRRVLGELKRLEKQLVDAGYSERNSEFYGSDAASKRIEHSLIEH